MVVVAFKGIKPSRLKVDAIVSEIKKELFKEGRDHRKELEKTVRTWRGAVPRFESLFEISRGDVSVITGPVGSRMAVQKWVWIDEGTKPHIIRARRVPLLRFRRGFRPKTVPRRFASRRGRRFGQWVSKKSVMHPGTEPREWTPTLTRRRKRPFTKRMIKAMQRGSAKVYK